MSYSKCVNCGGEKLFNPEKGVLVCERCGSNFDVKESSGANIRRSYSSTYSPKENKNDVVKYTCSTCGTRSVVGTTTEIRRCASCGNTTLTKDGFSTFAPDGIVPFKISRIRAAEIFRTWVGSRKFAPGDLKQMAKLEKITGLYTPIWNFNFTSIFSYSGMGIRIKTDTEGNQEYKTTPLEKEKEQRYTNVVLSASSRISDGFLNGMGGYEFSNIRPYSTDYLLGFAGIDTDVDIHDAYATMTNEITKNNERKTKKMLESEYDAIENLVCRTRYKDVAFNYTYVPVWANHYTYKGKEYHCYINGQTGKATGKAPKSVLKIGGLVLGILGGIAAIVMLIIGLL